MNDDLIAETAAQLERSARDCGLFVSGDLRVSEQAASALLGLNADYMRQLRSEGKGPVAYRAGVNGSRISYRISDLALWVESRREPVEITGVNDSDSSAEASHARDRSKARHRA